MTPTDNPEPMVVPYDQDCDQRSSAAGYETAMSEFCWSLVDVHQPDRVALGKMSAHEQNHWLLVLTRPLMFWNLENGQRILVKAVILVSPSVAPSGHKDVWLIDCPEYAQRIWVKLTAFKDT